MSAALGGAIGGRLGMIASVTLALVALSVSFADAARPVQCHHPVITGVEVFDLHHITSARACPVALALFHWEDGENHETVLYGCHGMLHPYLRLRTFHGWHLALTPELTMSRHGTSFAARGTDFPINCT